jgi:hypothetical protein
LAKRKVEPTNRALFRILPTAGNYGAPANITVELTATADGSMQVGAARAATRLLSLFGIYFKIYLDLFWARSRNLLVFLVLLMRRETVLCQDRLGTNKNGNDPYSQEKEETVSHTHVSLSLSHSHTFFLVFVWVCVCGGGADCAGCALEDPYTSPRGGVCDVCTRRPRCGKNTIIMLCTLLC